MKKLSYLSHIKSYILFSALAFLLAFYDGYLMAQSSPDQVAKILDMLKETFQPATQASGLGILLFIFSRNLVTLFFTIVLGLFGGVVPFLSVVSNGTILGILGYVVSRKFSWTVFAAGILPHGVIELPVLVVSAAMGLKLGKVAAWKIFSFLVRRPYKESLAKEFYMAMNFFISVLVPLLFLAALVESFITPQLLPVRSVL